MRFSRSLGAVVAVGVVGALVLPATTSAERTRFTFVTMMSGDEEAPGPGDSNGLGVAVIRINTATNEICYHLVALRIEPATMAHIHVGEEGDPGPVVQGLNPPTDRTSKGCVVNAMVADAIAEDPEAYYVNVHNTPFPGGAIRGQLG